MFAKEIRNCTVGVVGIGRIGLTTATLFKGLGANVLAYDAFPKEGVDHICTQVPLDELLAKSDVISIHAPYIPANGKVITKEFISKMKPGAILVNTARGELQDIDANHRSVRIRSLTWCWFRRIRRRKRSILQRLTWPRNQKSSYP